MRIYKYANVVRIIFQSYMEVAIRVIHKDLSYQLIGILYEAHNEVGRFASEKQVCDIIEMLLQKYHVPYFREYVIQPAHKGETIGRHRVDFLIDNKIILEIKCKRFLNRDDYYQIKRYLTQLNLKLGVLSNFQEERLHPKRILNSLGKE